MIVLCSIEIFNPINIYEFKSLTLNLSFYSKEKSHDTAKIQLAKLLKASLLREVAA